MNTYFHSYIQICILFIRDRSITSKNVLFSRRLKHNFLKEENIVELPNYLDPYHERYRSAFDLLRRKALSVVYSDGGVSVLWVYCPFHINITIPEAELSKEETRLLFSTPIHYLFFFCGDFVFSKQLSLYCNIQ